MTEKNKSFIVLVTRIAFLLHSSVLFWLCLCCFYSQTVVGIDFSLPSFTSRRRFVTNKRPKISEGLREVKTVMNKLSPMI